MDVKNGVSSLSVKGQFVRFSSITNVKQIFRNVAIYENRDSKRRER